MSLRVVSGNYDITGLISGLRYSNVAPGGDETCSFTFNRSWFVSSPEIEKGNVVRVMDGIDVLWQGRVEETVRGGDSTETIEVTAYGLGRRLKDATMQEIYVDMDLSRWGGPSVQRKINAIYWSLIASEPTTTTDTTTGQPSLGSEFSDTWAATTTPSVEAFYDAKGVAIGSLYYAWKRNPNMGTSAPWFWDVVMSSDDVFSAFDGPTTLTASGPGTGTMTASAGRYFASARAGFAAAGGTPGMVYAIYWTCLAVFGRHGLTKQGTATSTAPQGFLVSQIVADMAARASGITVRRVDATSFVLRQSAYLEPTVIEDAVRDANKYEAHQRTWGTWGPDSPLDSSSNGNFDYRAIDTTPSWIIFRSDCDSLPSLSSEMASLYDTAKVLYTDPSGAGQIVTRTRSVPDLNGIPRTITVNGGTLTTADAQTLGDTVLALSGGFAPARGSLSISRPVRHVTRGMLPAHYMRADGSAVRLPDILPSTTLFALDATPDRRTTFPIKRVEVDASDQAMPRVTVDVDQVNEAITALQNRLDLGVAGGSGGGVAAPVSNEWAQAWGHG